MASSSGNAEVSKDMKELAREEEERRDFEEDRFVRLVCYYLPAFLVNCSMYIDICITYRRIYIIALDAVSQGQAVDQEASAGVQHGVWHVHH